MFRYVLVPRYLRPTCAFAGYLGYGGYSMAAPWTSSYSTMHHAPAVSTLGYGHGLGYGYGLGYGHGIGYGYGMSGYGLGYGYGLGHLGHGGIYKK
uniref:Putative glycine rich protein n=1 Tax=Ixodes ricinus TaxID=34613 RepID=A0A0K8R5P1_IXORI